MNTHICNNSENKILYSDYPALYQAADTASVSAQQKYVRTLSWYLILLITAAGFSLFAKESQISAILAAIIFLSTIFLSVLLAAKKYNKVWYSGRALAESVKTRTWRFMMRTEPYNNNPESHEDRGVFLNDLRLILEQNRDIGQHLAHEFGTKDQITKKMASIRSSQLISRKDIYKTKRIDEQREWYSEKAGYNKSRTTFWFSSMYLFQGLAVITVLIRIAKPSWTFLPTEVLAVAAAAVLSWMQAKRFQELSTSYSLTSHEIGLIKGQLENIQSEHQFSDFVSDAENAFSREHTQWQARRDS